MISDDGDRDNRSVEDVVYPDTTKSCLVEQIPGLDYTEPAIHIQVAASDDVSYVTYHLSVGTEPGGNEVIDNQVFGGPSAIITQVGQTTFFFLLHFALHICFLSLHLKGIVPILAHAISALN